MRARSRKQQGCPGESASRGVAGVAPEGVNPRDGCAIADYLEGAFDLKGRLPDLEQQYMLGVIAKDVEAIQQEQGPAWRSPPSRLMEFCTEKELQNQTGHHVEEWPKVVTKEVMDNALDDLATMPP